MNNKENHETHETHGYEVGCCGSLLVVKRATFFCSLQRMEQQFVCVLGAAVLAAIPHHSGALLVCLFGTHGYAKVRSLQISYGWITVRAQRMATFSFVELDIVSRIGLKIS
jgi:hypothetical protein